LPLTIHCSMCGANIDADDLAIRREVVTCSHCSTVQRITAQGTRKAPGEIAAMKTPEGIRILREGPGRLTVVARHTRQSIVLEKSEIVRGTWIGLAIALGVTFLGGLASLPLLLIFGTDIAFFIAVSLFLIFCPVALAAVLISIFSLASRQHNLPPLRLKDKTLFPPNPGSKPLPADAIRQLYSTATRVLVRRPAQYVDNFSIFALTKDGRRVFLLGPMESAETALCTEELLEAEMHILDLPVYGDTALPRNEGRPLPASGREPDTEGLACDSCGAEMAVSPSEKRRGFAACPHCGSLMLLYAPGDSKPILGIPGAVQKDSQYLVETDRSGTTISERRSGKPAVRISKGKMEVFTAGAGRKKIALAGIQRLSVRDTGWVRKDFPALEEMAEGMDVLKEAMAYSGDVDPVKILIGAGANFRYAVLAAMQNGKEVLLLDGIRDIGEAFFLKGILGQA
jgi:DNA-directed RNA polymerase subunit RPC12/RpoP